MNTWWLVPFFVLPYISFGQESNKGARPGPADLVLPSAESPLSVEQVEDRTRDLPDGTRAVEITNSAIYRDSAGRMRIESIHIGSNELPTVFVIDPTNGFRILLSARDKIAYRFIGPKATESGFAHGVGGMGEGLPPGAWSTKMENLGRRTIDEIEVEGERVIQTSADQPSLTAIHERWYSSRLKLTCLAVSSGPGWKHTAKIRSLGLHEPDPSLFAIPSDYSIHDLKLP
jgi:hypothetical protein